MAWDHKNPWGKPGPNSTIVPITQDNIAHAEFARAARKRIAEGKGTLEDFEFVDDRERMIRDGLQGKEPSE